MAQLSNLKILKELSSKLSGELHLGDTIRRIYSTDASAYREMPQAVCFPKDPEDIARLVTFANKHTLPIIPRTAGTSLAGQVVGNGIIVDVSKGFGEILELNKQEGWVRVEPGVIRDELNMHLSEHGFLFGPETSTANRAMIGGMIGNNSCGSNSVVYGSTRDQLLSVEAILSDGTQVTFKSLSKEEFEDKCQGIGCSSPLEQNIYSQIKKELSNPEIRAEIEREFPKKSIPRRNTGYAIDLLTETGPFGDYQNDINLCKLIAGSEGTLAFITEATLKVHPLPPPAAGVIAIHFKTIYDSLLANLEALKFRPTACELIDHYILECTKDSITQSKNRFFVKGDPQAILVVEFKNETEAELKSTCEKLIKVLEEKKLGYHYPVLTGEDVKKVWELRKAGLGLLSNMPGDSKPAPVIEDTAVDVNDLPEYIREFNLTLERYDLFCVHYAHAGSGELHLRPILNLKTKEGNALFKKIAEEIALLVKKYKGSLSGEHGDGRLRGEFIPKMIGDKNYQLLKRIKSTWDPNTIFNPGKIVDSPAMNEQLRYFPGQKTRELDTFFRFEKNRGMQRATELCNGSGDCRKTELTGGTMCPSYMATRDEKDTTRARANILRETLSFAEKPQIFKSKEAKDILDLCLSCKGCKAECPSNVDMAKLKAEYMSQYYKHHSPSFRTRMMATFSTPYKIGRKAPRFFNAVMTGFLTAPIIKLVMGIAQKRSLPKLSKNTLFRWYRKNKRSNFGHSTSSKAIKTVYLFCDEFTNYNDGEIGISCLKLLSGLNYDVRIIPHVESGRTYLSKGFVKKAKSLAERNVRIFSEIVTSETPLIGLEPSAILSFRDEYPDLVSLGWKTQAEKLSKHCLTIEEFLGEEVRLGNIKSDQFTDEPLDIKLHGHCHQKALSSMVPSKKILSLPLNYSVQLIPSGCCGMAGSFGYEKEHYDISMQIGELVLFPAVRKAKNHVIAAAGTSCRHQIKDGTGRVSLHPVEILLQALKSQ